MDNNDRIQLEKLVKGYGAVDTTDKIRELKHSSKIRQDILNFNDISKKYVNIKKNNPAQFEKIMVKYCNFLFNHYTIIFNKLKKGNLNLNLMIKFIDELKNIEDGKYDQHEASTYVGKILKEIYIDSALCEQSKIESKLKHKKTVYKKPIANNLSWKKFKTMNMNG